MRRRSFLGTPLAVPLAAQSTSEQAPHIDARGDGIPHSPAEYAQLLSRLTGKGTVVADEFSRGGIVEKLEAKLASVLGKEAAVWFPTGTLANHTAVRLLAGANRRVLVQAESHLYRDSGDCAQMLSGLNLIPLAHGQATFALDEVERAFNDSQLGRVLTPVGAIQIETPVRRRMGERFDFPEMTRIAKWARERRIGLHLDGARLFIEAVYTGRPVQEYTSLFDTVYVSLYKYFNAASGAILVGPKASLANLYHVRRMFGGGLPQVWPMATVADHYVDHFAETFPKAKQISEEVIGALSKDASFSVERIPNGTNIFKLKVHSVNPGIFQTRLEETGISVALPAQDWFSVRVNATWAGVQPRDIVAKFRKALG